MLYILLNALHHLDALPPHPLEPLDADALHPLDSILHLDGLHSL